MDPKKKNFFNYHDVTIFKPNLKELNEGLKTELQPTDFEKIHNAAQDFGKSKNINNIIITLSEYGILVSGKNKFTIIPSEKRDIADVSGAGDTVISVLTLCMISGCNIIDATRMANLAGGLVCEKVGVVPVSHNHLLIEALNIFL